MSDKILFRGARLIDPEALTETSGDLLVEGGRISAGDPAGARVVECAGRCLAPGLIDIGVKVGEPGARQKESYATAGRAAAAGGVTTIVTRPDTNPAIDTPETLQFIHRRAQEDCVVRTLPMACLTRGRLGREMTEIGFLRDAGAVAFYDADAPVRDARIFSRLLAYAGSMDALVIAHSQDPDMSAGASMTASPYTTQLALPGVSPMAERIQVARDLALAEAAGARIHIDAVTTAAGLGVLARARGRGVRATAGISVHHLTLNLFDVGDYRTFFKMKPPLRSEDDRMACVAALADGEVDIICSMHTPQDEESKRLPFEDAAYGAVGLETLLPAALQLVHAGEIGLPQLIRALTLNPAELLGLDSGRLQVGAPADLVLFDPDVPFRLDRHQLRSKSKNTPYDGRLLNGRVLATYVGGRAVFEHEGESA